MKVCKLRLNASFVVLLGLASMPSLVRAQSSDGLGGMDPDEVSESAAVDSGGKAGGPGDEIAAGGSPAGGEQDSCGPGRVSDPFYRWQFECGVTKESGLAFYKALRDHCNDQKNEHDCEHAKGPNKQVTCNENCDEAKGERPGRRQGRLQDPCKWYVHTCQIRAGGNDLRDTLYELSRQVCRKKDFSE